MKAHIKATGEIVEIYRFVDTNQNEWIDCYLEFLEPITTDYWTRLEHQAAIAAMQGLLSNPSITERELTTRKGIVEDAERLAHALVEKLKDMEERK